MRLASETSCAGVRSGVSPISFRYRSNDRSSSRYLREVLTLVPVSSYEGFVSSTRPRPDGDITSASMRVIDQQGNRMVGAFRCRRDILKIRNRADLFVVDFRND